MPPESPSIPHTVLPSNRNGRFGRSPWPSERQGAGLDSMPTLSMGPSAQANQSWILNEDYWHPTSASARRSLNVSLPPQN